MWIVAPFTISTVVGLKGTPVFSEPRVATLAHGWMLNGEVIVYVPVAVRAVLPPNGAPRAGVPLPRAGWAWARSLWFPRVPSEVRAHVK